MGKKKEKKEKKARAKAKDAGRAACAEEPCVPEGREPLYDDCGLDLPGPDAYAWAGPAPEGLTEAQRAELSHIADGLFARLSGKRLAHSLSVARTAGRLAAAHGADPFLAQAAGLLHDWDKRLPEDELWEKAARLGVMPAEGRDARLAPVLHGLTAAASLPTDYPELPAEVFQAVARHTMGAVRMSALDMAVFCADLLEPLRGPSFDELRGLASGPLEGLAAACCRHNLLFVLATGRYLGQGGVEVWNAYEPHLPQALRGRRCRILFEDAPAPGPTR